MYIPERADITYLTVVVCALIVVLLALALAAMSTTTPETASSVGGPGHSAIPVWNGDKDTLDMYQRRTEIYVRSIKAEDKVLAGSRLVGVMPPNAFEIVKNCDLDELSKETGPTYLLTYIREQVRAGREFVLAQRFKELIIDARPLPKDTPQQIQITWTDLHRRCKDAGCDLPETLLGWLLIYRLKLRPEVEAQIIGKSAGQMKFGDVLNELKNMLGDKRCLSSP